MFPINYTTSQLQAIRHRQGPVLICAGPGSGKTAVLTAHVHYLIRELGVSPDQILTVTFTKAAAQEMLERYLQIMNHTPSSSDSFSTRLPRFGTIHSVFFEILRLHYGTRRIRLIRDTEREEFWISQLQKIPAVQKAVSDQPEYLEELIRSIFSGISYKINAVKSWENILTGVLSSDELQQLYRRYQTYKRSQRLLDYDDILSETVYLLKEDLQFRRFWQSRYTHILLDEFQDINRLQYEGLCLLASPENNLFAVGDEDQCIYGFRGSSPDIIRKFLSDYPACRCLSLTISHRAPDILLSPARRMIRNNPDRISGDVTGVCRQEDASFEITSYTDQLQQYRSTARRAAAYKNGGIPFSRQAILLRSFRNLFLLETALTEAGVSFCVPGHRSSMRDHFIVKDLSACLETALGRVHRDSLLRILILFCPHISRNRLPQKCSVHTLPDLLHDYRPSSPAVSELQDLLRHLQFLEKLSSYAAVEYILRAMGYERHLQKTSRSAGAKPEVYTPVLRFIRESASQQPVPASFLRLLQTAEDGSDLPEDDLQEVRQDALHILTMHGSKGLEFDVVFIPDVNKGVIPSSQSEHPDREEKEETGIQEERRLLYVAMTRARRHLHMSFVERVHGKPVFPSRFLYELQDNLQITK